MTEQKAYDLGRFQRIVGVEGPMVRGNFTALSTRDGSDTIVQPLEVTIYHDESHHSGRILKFGELTAWVHPDGSVDMSRRSISDDKRAEVESVWEEMVNAVRLVAEAAKFEWKDQTAACPTCEGVVVMDGRPMTCGACGEPLRQAAPTETDKEN